MPSLESLTRIMAPGPVTISPRQCTRNRHQVSSCRKCLDICPAGCLSSLEEIALDEDRCHGCGLCAGVCTAGVFNVREPAWEHLVSRVKGKEAVEIRCGRASRGSARTPESITVESRCLGWITFDHLADLAFSGIHSITLVAASCDGCGMAAVGDLLCQTVAGTKEAFANTGLTADIRFSVSQAKDPQEEQEKVSPGPTISRRELFSFWKRKSVESAIEIASEYVRELPDDPKRLPYLVPRRRMRWVSGLRTWADSSRQGASSRLDSARLTDLPLSKKTIDSTSCIGCGMCTNFCPSGALRKGDFVSTGENPGIQVITHEPARCLACGLCHELCPQKAISRCDLTVADVLSPQPQTLVTHIKKRCEQCDGVFLSRGGDPICSHCRADLSIERRFFGGDSPNLLA